MKSLFKILVILLAISTAIILECSKTGSDLNNKSVSEINGTNKIDGKIYIITGNNVNIRTQPNLTSKVVAQSHKGDEVVFIKKSDSKMKVGSDEHYWIQVKLPGEQQGWVYGKYLSLKTKAEAHSKWSKRYTVDSSSSRFQPSHVTTSILLEYIIDRVRFH